MQLVAVSARQLTTLAKRGYYLVFSIRRMPIASHCGIAAMQQVCAGWVLPNPLGGVRRYSTFRALYTFTWDERIGVYESRARVFDIVSPARIDAEVLPRRIDDAIILALDHEQTDPDTFRYDHGWLTVYDSDADGLLRRTEEYSEGLIAVHTK